MTFTFEEENLICCFDVSSREIVLNDIRTAMPNFDEPEVYEIAKSAIIKLNNMSDADFLAYSFCPVSDEETEVIVVWQAD